MDITRNISYAFGSLAIAIGIVVLDPTAAITVSRTETIPATVIESDSTSETICGFEYPTSNVVSIAADEIAKLQKVYPSVCDVTWSFAGMSDYLGLAYDNDQNLILISTVEAYYTQGGDNLDDIVRHVIRHEFGHQVTYETHSAYFPENATALADLFQTTPDVAYEIAADAMSMAMDPTNSFPRDVTPEQVETARVLLQPITEYPSFFTRS